MRKILFYLSLCIILTSCLDSLKSIQEDIVGNISVIDSNDEEGGRFGLNYYNSKENFYSHIVYDYVTDISGNDTTLIVKCLDRMNCKDVFYIIKHDMGRTIENVRKVDINEYNQTLSALSKAKYKFHTNKTRCP